MENCSNIFAYARNMLLACTPTINWFLFGKHFTYFPLLPRIRYSISCAMAVPLCDFLLCPLQALDVISLFVYKNPSSFWSYPYIMQHIMIYFCFHTTWDQDWLCSGTPSLSLYCLPLTAILKLFSPDSIWYITGICKHHLPSWLFSGHVQIFLPDCITWESLC